MNSNLSKALISGAGTKVPSRASTGGIFGGPRGGVYMRPAYGPNTRYVDFKRSRD